eukprot:g353.t1
MLNLEDVIGDIIQVKVKSTNNSDIYKLGKLYTIDRLAKYIILITQRKANSNANSNARTLSVIYFHAIERIYLIQKGSILGDIENTRNNNKTRFVAYPQNFSIEVQKKQKKILALLSERNLSPTLNDTSGVISLLNDAAQILPPYTDASCKAINPIILIRLKTLLSSIDDAIVVDYDDFQMEQNPAKEIKQNVYINSDACNCTTNSGSTNSESNKETRNKSNNDEAASTAVTTFATINEEKKHNSFQCFLNNPLVHKWKYNIDDSIESHILDHIGSNRSNFIFNINTFDIRGKNQNIQHMVPITGFLHGQTIFESKINAAGNKKTTYVVEKLAIVPNQEADVSLRSIETRLSNLLLHKNKIPSIIGYFVANIGFGTAIPNILDTSLLPFENEGCFMIIDLLKSNISEFAYKTYSLPSE